ncbi:MAG: YceI family protein, partial [Actinomycetota bacterium]
MGGVVVVAVLGFVGVPYVYIHLIDKTQAPLSINAATGSTAASPTASTASGDATTSESIDGTWTIASGSTAGYRVNEVLDGQSHVATGRTTNITGSLTVTGGSVVTGTFSADMAAVTSDQSQRDGQFRGRIMDTADYPVATFAITAPIAIGDTPADGTVVTKQVTGQLLLHGTSKAVTFTASIKKTGSTVAVSGDIPIVFADYGIPNPS